MFLNCIRIYEGKKIICVFRQLRIYPKYYNLYRIKKQRKNKKNITCSVNVRVKLIKIQGVSNYGSIANIRDRR